MYRLMLIALALVSGAACHDRNDNTVAPIPMTAPTPAPDVIEYRVSGTSGGAPVAIKFSDAFDGLTLAPAVNLPYLATVQSTDTEIFVYLEAQTNILTTASGLIQVQIVINGRVFREAYAQGAGALDAVVSGTWRRN